MDQFSYKVLEPNRDPKLVVLEKGGITASFTVLEVEQMEGRHAKARTEMVAQIEVEKATMENIVHFHPSIKDLSDEELVAAALYQNAKHMIKECEAKIKHIDEASAQNQLLLATALPLAEAAAKEMPEPETVPTETTPAESEEKKDE